MQLPSLRPSIIWLIGDDRAEVMSVYQVLKAAVRRIEMFNSWEAGLDAVPEARLQAAYPNLILGVSAVADPNLPLVFHHLRAQCDAPLVLVLPSGLDSYLPVYLRSGVDDFLVRPYGPQALFTRLQIALRRNTPAAPQSPALYQDGYLTIDPAWHRVVVDGAEIACTALEMKLLRALVSNQGRTVTTAALLEAVWDTERDVSSAHLHRHISRLRRKIELAPQQTRYVHTVHGVGYRFDPQG